MKSSVGILLLVFSSTILVAQEHLPIIDMHLHAIPAESVRDEVAIPGLTRQPTEEAIMRETLRTLERNNVVKALVSGPVEMIYKWKAAAPDRLIASPYIMYDQPWPKLVDLRAAYSHRKLGALGEIGAQYLGLSLSSPEFEPYLALAEEFDVPVSVHTGSGPPGVVYSCCPRFRTALGNPILVEEALVRHPKLRLYIMHAGYPFFDETVSLLTAYPQVYVDLAVIDWVLPREEFHDYLRRLVRAGFGKRLMFGSDQMVWPQTIEIGIKAIESADFLTAEQKRDIFYSNAARFLRIEEKNKVPR